MTAASRFPLLPRLLFVVPLLLVGLGFLLRHPLPTQPLSSGNTVLVLLAPGMNLADWHNTADAPVLAQMAFASPLAVMPTRTAGNDPNRLRDACGTLGNGSRSRVAAPGAFSLGETLRQNHVHTVVIADDDGAASALVAKPTDAAGERPAWRVEAPAFPDGCATDPVLFASAIQSAATAKKTLIVADFDDLYRADRYAPLALPQATKAHRREALHRFDQCLTALRQIAVPLLLVSPVAEKQSEARGERLAPILLWQGPKGEGHFFLTSPSTRQQPGLIANTDVAATIATLLGLPPDSCHIGAGRPAALAGAGFSRRNDSVLRAKINIWSAQARAQRALIYVPWCLGVLLLLAGFLSGEAREAVRACAAALSVGIAAFPLLLLLNSALVFGVSSAPPNTVYAVTALGCVIFTALLAARPGRPYLRTALWGTAATTALVYLADTSLGGPLHAAGTPLSYAVTEAARFYGIGNEAEGVLIGAVLLAYLGSGMKGAALIGGGAAVAVIVGHPFFGADAGALLGLFVGLGTAITLSSATVPRRRLFTGIAATVAVLLMLLFAYGWWDGTRSVDSRSHVGEAVAAARAHGAGVLTGVAARKAAMNAHLTVSSPWAALLAAEVALVVFLWRRQKESLSAPDRLMLVSLYAAALALYVFNDSGVVAAATCLLWALPLLLVPPANEKGSDSPSEITPLVSSHS